jgi:hypothetical protein
MMDKEQREKLMDEAKDRRSAETESYLSVPMIRRTVTAYSKGAKEKGFKKVTVKVDKRARVIA